MAGIAVVSGSVIALGAAGILPVLFTVLVGTPVFPAGSWLLGRLAYELWRKSKNKRARNVQSKQPRQ
jgi:hypothetical protein